MIDPGYLRLHADAMGVLTAWDHPEPEQRMLREDYLRFLREFPEGMSRDCGTGHVTASALVMDEGRTRVLLTLHPKVGRWLQLGGHCEVGDETLLAAARRETIEESGIPTVAMSEQPIRLDRHPVPCGGSMNEHLDVQYLALVPADATAIMSAESDDLQWFPVDALPSPLDPSVRAIIATALREH